MSLRVTHKQYPRGRTLLLFAMDNGGADAQGLSYMELLERSGIEHQRLLALIRGEQYADVGEVSAIEAAFGPGGSGFRLDLHRTIHRSVCSLSNHEDDCEWCGASAEFLCDGQIGRCDRLLCAACADWRGMDSHRCPDCVTPPPRQLVRRKVLTFPEVRDLQATLFGGGR